MAPEPAQALFQKQDPNKELFLYLREIVPLSDNFKHIAFVFKQRGEKALRIMIWSKEAKVKSRI